VTDGSNAYGFAIASTAVMMIVMEPIISPLSIQLFWAVETLLSFCKTHLIRFLFFDVLCYLSGKRNIYR